jgi:hypothetical protein
VFGDVTNFATGQIVVSGRSNATFYDDLANHGTFHVGAGSTAVCFGSYSGAGTQTGTGTVFLEGDLRPGASPGAASFEGDLVCGAGLVTTMELGGPLRGTDYDCLQVAGQLTLDGLLAVTRYGAYQPAAGSLFDLFDWGTLSGRFAAIELPALDAGLEWVLDDLYTTGEISVRGTAPPAPANLAATPRRGLSVHLAWDDTSPPAPGFDLERALDPGFTSELHSVSLPAGQTAFDDTGLRPETTYHYRVRAHGSPAPSGFSAPATAIMPTRLADWRWVNFGNPAPAGDGADLADPDQDGAVNLTEYAANLNPLRSDVRPLAAGGLAGLPVASRGPDGRLALTFLRRTDASLPTIAQQPLWSTDLVSWHPEPTAATFIETIDPLWDRVTVTDPWPAAPRRFVRLVVNAP